ncbi:hypothetical protein CH299_11455 [Rhodococcus sp. 14-2686-1-2]|nr:hypothetical protein CH301_10905 [Rhodococcus sp. 15-1189-1-1a]OZF15606.1 hypothetical protein CH299_11455 [Rhodococcus sp. 14-2686-1-2]
MLFAYLAVLALIFGALIAAFTGDDASETTAPPAAALPTSAVPSTTATVTAGPDCSMPAGDQNSGEGVIAAFEHAYYVQRSGTAAHALVSPNAPSSAPFTVVANLDAGIATVAEGTTYCLDIDPLRPGVFTLTLTESGPGGPGTQYRQRITTTEVDGRYVIASIDQA